MKTFVPEWFILGLMKKLKEYFIKIALKMRAKTLEKMLKKTFTNSTSKTIISSTETMTLNSKTLVIIENIKNNVKDITKTTGNNPQKLIDYIEAQGTKVYKIKNANTILQKINEHTGFITELCGIKAIYVNVLTGQGIGFKSKSMFIISDKQTDYYMLLREFYLWYSMNMKLPGFDFKTQEKFKKYIKNSQNASFKGLHYSEMLKIKEAIARDKEANEFVMELIREKDGGSNVFGKMTSGGANI